MGSFLYSLIFNEIFRRTGKMFSSGTGIRPLNGKYNQKLVPPVFKTVIPEHLACLKEDLPEIYHPAACAP
jgi:hypothetical protein